MFFQIYELGPELGIIHETNMSQAAPGAPRIFGNVQQPMSEDELPRLDDNRFSSASRRRLSGANLQTFVLIANLLEIERRAMSPRSWFVIKGVLERSNPTVRRFLDATHCGSRSGDD